MFLSVLLLYRFLSSSATLQGSAEINYRTVSNLHSFIISNIHKLDVLQCFLRVKTKLVSNVASLLVQPSSGKEGTYVGVVTVANFFQLYLRSLLLLLELDKNVGLHVHLF